MKEESPDSGKRHAPRLDPVLTNEELGIIQKSYNLRKKLQQMMDEKDASEESISSQELMIGDLLNANQLLIKKITYFLKEGEGREELTTGIVQSNTHELIRVGKNLSQVIRCIQSLGSTMSLMPPMQFEDHFLRMFIQNPEIIFQRGQM